MGTEREWTVSGMDCAACTVKIKTALGRLPGVSGVEVALMTERLRLTLEDGTTPGEKVEATVRALGYGIGPRRKGHAPAAAPHDHDHDHHNDHDHNHDRAPHGHDHVGHDHAAQNQARGEAHDAHGHIHDDPAERGMSWYQTAKGRLVLTSGALVVLAYGAELLLPPGLGRWAFTLACLIGLAPVARRAFVALRMGQPFTIESLMTIAALGALAIDAAAEAAIVVFLFAVGEVLEGVAASKARDGIRALGALVPKTALLLQDGSPVAIAAEALVPGQSVLVRPGDRIPADGVVTDGQSGVDESPVTGESVPVTRGPGDAVFAGTINAEAALTIRVSKAAADNTIARIVRLVEEAEEARAPTERFIDRFSRWYMPAITGFAALVVLVPPLALGLDWTTWLYRGLSLLLIGCPCALVISVPASIASALSSGARRGLLMKGGAVIEEVARVRQVAFDKTGTLTHGRPAVTDVLPFGGESEASVLTLAAAVEAGSSHPLAVAILNRATGLPALPASDARAIPGMGAEAVVGGQRAFVGSPRHAKAQGALTETQEARAATMEAEGKTVAVVCRDGAALGLIAMRDEARADAAAAMVALKSLGVSAVMLTGDNPRTAEAVAGTLGLDFRAGMLPEDKLREIEAMAARGWVMMIGDGINDAPALKRANVGVAMGSGTDVALETADAAILRNRVADVPAMIRLARATMGNIRQNVGLALGLKAVFLVTSILGVTGLWVAILADTGATVLVTMNALRLLRHDPSQG